MFVSLSLFVISNASGVGVYLAEADFFFAGFGALYGFNLNLIK